MADHTLTPAELAMVDATIARVRADRADAGIMGARYDDACARIAEQHDEIVKLRRRAEALEDQLRDRDAHITELEAEVDRADLRADRRATDLRARGKRICELEQQLAATTNPDRAEEHLAADARPASTCGCGHPHAAHWGESASGRTECMTAGCPCGGADVPRGPRSPSARPTTDRSST